MTLLGFIRHAHAGDPAAWPDADALRPLSDKGRRQAERLGRHLASLEEEVTLFITSPRLRARETAEIVAAALGVEVIEDERLGGGFDIDDIDDILADAGSPDRPVLVGHDPDFSDVLGALIGTGPIGMRKGAFAQVEVSRPVIAGRGSLRVLLPPDLLPRG